MKHPKYWEAIGGQVLILDDEAEESVNAAGIIIAKEVEENQKLKQGTILSVSKFLLESGETLDPPFKEGDKVVYGSFAAAGNTIYASDKRTYRLARWNEILAIVREPKSK